ncbi:MAG: threonine--tRNA ligase [Deltaproteobacteria bacterium RIFCSPLOWO2_12_FULL_43_16]|nr:MAG: threonine--tRNA ligase [Deltaproteobacteria bacterium GWA2_43_19]OGQ10838.1 MAG: threonine--tRNA ligase [Deltaproteobacteria bacterium RIFCSPHIGHO2_02_FULL_43_33]OGQ33946.1 MAG: threonine--tRNA ligase [Deltaproteobacteria bacterium RIFCSPLOWO2_01_FULL_42_9]OGQ59921.1 MAG: threonine--tRNA ligase [Deltaproteobacteria bacterium RIFCSPLOWO2_12_FULL_43_16]HBR18362.1 threonine--tRNA ligase [Deltaproteobacteria bacterium]
MNRLIKITFPDGKHKEYAAGTTAEAVLKDFDRALLKTAVAAEINGKYADLTSALSEDSAVKPILLDSKEGLEIYRHSTSHVMAQAVKDIFDGIKVTIGPSIEDGFYYDFDSPHPFTPEDLKKIEKHMLEIIKKNKPFERTEVSKKDAIKLFGDMGEIYKQELINEIPGGKVNIYQQDGFVDLCRGPHLPSTGWIKAFKLTGIAGAYWRGDEKNKMLQRIYGTAFPTKQELDDYLYRVEEAKKRDHRKLGKELDLFSMHDAVGSGLVCWHPNGAVVRSTIEDFWKKEHYRHGYQIIYTPHIAKVDLWKTSGHWEFYRENLYSPMDIEGQDFIVKPMNCPFHIQIYQSGLRSYRDLPIRYAELGTVYRFERSGVLHGLLRVRGFTQDDAHIFCRPNQLEDEISKVLNFTLYILRSFGFNNYDIYLSTRPEKFVGALDNWNKAEDALKHALEKTGLKFQIDPGEGVFYGPKIDIKIKDTLGRAWQCSTIQVDFNLPQRFNIAYRGEDGKEHQPIMIHRALMGSLERFFGVLIEHYAGAFPLWLAPVQAIVLTITEKNNEYAQEVFNALRKEDIRAELDIRNEKLGLKVREAQLKKIPYMLVVGDKEEEKKVVAPRTRSGSTLEPMAVEDFVEFIAKENKPHSVG